MERAINRKEALDLLQVQDEEVILAIKSITPQTLQAEYKYSCEQYLAAMHFQVRGMQRIARKYLLHLSWINKHHFKGRALPEEITHTCAENILEEMLLMSADLPLTRTRKDMSDSEETEQEDVTCRVGKCKKG